MIDRAYIDRLADIAMARGNRFVYCRFHLVNGELRSRVTNPWNPAGWLA